MSTAPVSCASEPFVVSCFSCKGMYDAAVADFCACLATERSLVCPTCNACACGAPSTYKRRFWAGAPRELWNRKFAEQNRRSEESPNPAPHEVGRPLVLLVDDEADIRRLARLEILALGYGLVVARHGQEGLELARLYRPDLVLTDALMPKLDGRDMCRQIKQDPALSGTKVVVMTSLYKGIKYETQAYKSYLVDGYLEKPLQFERLKAVLGTWLPIEGRKA